MSDDEERHEQKVAVTPLERAARELPVARYRPEIVETIRAYPVTIIEGALLRFLPARTHHTPHAHTHAHTHTHTHSRSLALLCIS